MRRCWFVGAIVATGLLVLAGCRDPYHDAERDPVPTGYPSELPKGFVRLSGEEIKTIISGMSLAVNRQKSPNSMSFSETFSRDGSWESTVISFSPWERSGNWAISDDQVCVKQKASPTSCRNIWYNQITKDVALRYVAVKTAKLSICTLSSAS